MTNDNPSNRLHIHHAPKTMSGVVLTQNVQDRYNGIVISLWIKTAKGAVKLEINDEKALFFVPTTQVSHALSLLNKQKLSLSHTKELPLKTFGQELVSAFYFNTLRDFYLAKDCLSYQGVTCYETDIRPDERYLMERFITSTLTFTGVLSQSKVAFPLYKDVKCKRYDVVDTAEQALKVEENVPLNIQPTLTMVSFDVECDYNGELFSIGFYNELASCVFMRNEDKNYNVDESNQPDHITIIWVTTELELLQQFILWIKDKDPDILIGWNVINFDMDLLQKRCDLHNIIFAIGRDSRAPYWRKNKNNEQKYIEVAGRVVLDGIDLLRTATYNFASFSLDNVAHELLGKGKKVDDVENRMAEIQHNFKHNKVALAVYNLEDCRLVWEIFAKTQLLEFAMLRAQLTGLSLDRVGGSVAAFTNLYLPKLHRSGYVAPNMGDGASGLISPGGYVMDSQPGLYKNVLVLDFKSLYPSIIRTFNIDPMGLIEGIQEAQALSLPVEFDALESTSELHEPVKGFDHAYFSRKAHFLPNIITELWHERDKAKADKNAALSQAIKIIMNSFYGVLGSTGCRFFDPRLSGSITKRSHALLKQTEQWIASLGYNVIYGDTDSIFVHVGEDKSLAESREIGKDLEVFINEKMQAYLNDTHNVKSALEIEFETHFSTFLMPTIRGLEVGTKKRYAGMVLTENLDGIIKQNMIYKGLETVRTDWTELAKEFQQALYLKVFNQEEVHHYITDIVAKTLAGNNDDKLVYRKRIRRRLNEYVKNVPPHVKAARLADNHNQEQGKPLRYQNKGWIEYYMTVNGPQAKEHLYAPIDHQFYIERQLEAVADGILPFIGTTFNEITNKQLSFF